MAVKQEMLCRRICGLMQLKLGISTKFDTKFLDHEYSNVYTRNDDITWSTLPCNDVPNGVWCKLLAAELKLLAAELKLPAAACP